MISVWKASWFRDLFLWDHRQVELIYESFILCYLIWFRYFHSCSYLVILGFGKESTARWCYTRLCQVLPLWRSPTAHRGDLQLQILFEMKLHFPVVVLAGATPDNRRDPPLPSLSGTVSVAVLRHRKFKYRSSRANTLSWNWRSFIWSCVDIV